MARVNNSIASQLTLNKHRLRKVNLLVWRWIVDGHVEVGQVSNAFYSAEKILDEFMKISAEKQKAFEEKMKMFKGSNSGEQEPSSVI